MAIRIRDLHVTYPGTPVVRALRGVSLRIPPGEVTALIGPNGAGKSTTISCVMGLVHPLRGTITFGGEDLLGPKGPALRRRIGCAPQEEALFPVLTVADNIRLFCELAGLRGAAMRRRITEVAEAFLVGDLLGRKVVELSGGQRRRVHSAIALVGRPEVVILDEPTAGVDPATRSAVLEVVRNAAREGAAVCYSTHYLPEVTALGARVSVIDHGQVIASGTVAQLLERHATTAIHLRFDGPAPRVEGLPGDMTVLGEVIQLHIPDARSHVGKAVRMLGDHADALVGVEVIAADLDAVFQNLTGRSLSPTEPSAHDVAT
jgi:ABC-2 type transport system ATP-binding protein